jgi:D-sedoheptulose 7-phosphate isomerase
MSFTDLFFGEVISIAEYIDKNAIEDIVENLVDIRDNNGRMFILGVGGSAGNASHMTNDFRKLCNLETYCPTDNVSELTARTNDEGFDTIFEEYLKISKFNDKDCIFILSVGGGNEEKNVSVGLIKAIKYAKVQKGKVFGIVGRKDGYTAQNADVAIVILPVEGSRVTPHSEAFQSIVWHCIVSHPAFQINKTKW